MNVRLTNAEPTRRIEEATGLIDSERLRQELSALYQELGSDSGALRRAALDLLKASVTHGRDEARRRLEANGKGTQCASNIAHVQDEIIRVIHDFTVTHIYRARNPSAAERVSIVAVGGYGRGTLAPGSDIDLLFLRPYKQTAWGESVIEYMLYMLWDMGFKVGHATRSVDECIRLARADMTIMTAVLEARYIWGDKGLYEELVERYRGEIEAEETRQFIAAKLAERDERHRHAGSSRYLVEPDVKDGKGGLRDLHTLFWIAKFLYGTNSTAALVKKGVFTRAEYRRFRRREDFLWVVRCHLHFMTGRADNRLTFDLQRELAQRLGYVARGGLRDVERFMKHYFLVAKDVGDLTRIFCAVLEAQQVKKPPVMGRMLDRLRRRPSRSFRSTGAFKLDTGRVTVEHDNVFRDDPVNLLRLFHLADRHGMAIHPDALKLVRRSLRLIDNKLRTDGEANALFLEMLSSKSDPETILRRMNEAGVLGRFIPDFGRIVALMQFNMYHHYTVDEHLIRAIGVLAHIEHGELGDDHPLAHEIVHKITSRRALYVALFLHDIAKGRKESHSIAGERIAKLLCPRLGLTPAETETVAWLVRHHLTMSDYAQMRDLNDYKTILDFAAIVQSPERLKLLLILTVADIKAVGPGVWNGWKGQLLRTLYFETEPILTGGHIRISRAERLSSAMNAFRQRMDHWESDELERYIRRHYEPYWLLVDTDHQVKHAELIAEQEAKGRSIATAVNTDSFTEITELTVFAPDHPRLLALLTGACAGGGASIVNAQIFTTVDGMALDTLLLRREFTDEADEYRRTRRIAGFIEKALAGKVRISDLIDRQQRPQARIRAFRVEPQVIIDNDSSNRFTVIEVNGLDRIGLLHDLTEALFRLNLNIGSAQITTFGERAVDVFYVTDLTGAKITNTARRNAIRRHLMAVLDPDAGAETSTARIRVAG